MKKNELRLNEAEEKALIRQVRQSLAHSGESLSPKAELRLAQARKIALTHQKQVAAARRQLASGRAGSAVMSLLGPVGQRRRRHLLAALALLTGLSLGFYWQQVDEELNEMEMVDSALLADDLPPDAFLDKGFSAWLNRSQDDLSGQ